MGFGEAVSTVLNKYADFNGRARRSEYWFWALAVFIVFFVLEILSFAVHVFFVLLILVALGLLVPNLAVAVRRMHDIGKSGWFILIGLVPFVGGIILLVFSCMDSQPDNQYGPSPKYSGGGYGGGYGGQPPYGGQPQWGAPPPAQPQWGAPPPAQPQYGQPQYGAPPPAQPYAPPPVQPPYMPPPEAPGPYQP